MILKVLHLVLAAAWMGSMAYSLTIVQPKVARFFRDPESREEFLATLADGNRQRVLALVAVLLASGLAVLITSRGIVALGYGVALGLYVAATAIFVNVSWRHWPARIFARPEEVPGYQARLRVQAMTMLALVGAAFVVALAVSVCGW